MTTAAQLRKTALSHPETHQEGARPGAVTYSVGGEPFAALGEDGRVELHLPAAEADEVMAAHPTAERLTRGVRIPLGDIDGQQLNHWVRRAWLARSPRRLAEAATVRPGQVGDLPRAIGRPATQALVSAGITTLAQVAALSEAELSALHGVGPKAIRVLREAIGR
ncbi:helix-hairpin-helix domain-containing protein [Phytohabitans kaempferiae]|uniref:Helix-hairpin-helix domain-containing protein n=1 Tax=Phytohabitans kaempferiae TaxID=1620943 RepID=A0ABV6MH55_9ACTN